MVDKLGKDGYTLADLQTDYNNELINQSQHKTLYDEKDENYEAVNNEVEQKLDKVGGETFSGGYEKASYDIESKPIVEYFKIGRGYEKSWINKRGHFLNCYYEYY
ncbi:MAG: hypothetical protein JSR97_05230 [Verrucomicrobia bacterium]|nr:hypothetical protein [Verrucomicrobiota bacterium]